MKRKYQTTARIVGKTLLVVIPGFGLLGVQRTEGIPTVLANPPASPVVPQVTQDNPPGEMDVFIPAGTANTDPLPAIFKYGPVKLHPHVSYNFSYGNGIQSGPGNQQSTVIQSLSPGFLLDLGPHWALDYTPTIRFYSSREFRDGVDHAVALTGATRYQDWSFGLSQGIAFSTAPTVETGTQTEQQSYTTALTASRSLNSRMSADFSLSQNLNFADGAGVQNSSQWSTMEWLNYQFWPRMNVGVGLGGGYVKTDLTDQTFEQLQVRMNWRLTDKISVQVNGGGEARQISSGGSSDQLTPVYGAAIQYQPFKYTQLSLGANRSVSPSYLLGQNSDVTSLNVGLNQRLLGKFQLAVMGSYSQTVYAAAGVATSRSDDNYSVNISLSRPFAKRGTWSVFYQYGENTSSDRGYGYQSNQVGFSIAYRY